MDSLHLINTLLPEAGGPSVSVKRMIEGLSAQGDRATVVTYDRGPEVAGAINRMFAPQLAPKKLGFSLPLWKFLEQQRCSRTTAIHVHNMWMMNAIFPALLKLKFVQSPRGCLTDFSMQSGSPIKPLYWKLVQRKALSMAACFHVTSESEVADLYRLGFRQPAALIPHGVDVPGGVVIPPSRQQRTLIYLGRIHAEKGLPDLLRVWSNVQPDFPYWRLLLVGPETDATGAWLRGEIERRQISGVRFQGALYGADKTALLRQADLLVLPSPTENFGMAVAEALAHQVPAIANRGSPWSQLESKGAGWWIDRGDSALEAALRVAMSLPEESLKRMGEAGRKWVESDFSWRRAAEQMSAVYSWLWEGAEVPSCVLMH